MEKKTVCTFRRFYGILGIIIITNCTPAPPREPPTLPKPLRFPENTENHQSDTVVIPPMSATSQVADKEHRIRFQATPSIPVRQLSASLSEESIEPRLAPQNPIKVNIEGLPLPAFINEVFGNLLGLSFEIDAQLQNKKELVTLRISETQQPKQLYNIARQVLTNYGVAVEPQGDLIRFLPERDRGKVTPSLITRGITLPEVPPTHRPIFQFIPLKVVRNTQIKRWLTKLYQGHDLTIDEDAERNAIVLTGTPELVNQASKAIKVLDQPLMRGQHSLRIEPVFLTAEVLANELIRVLNSEGYAASNTPQFGSIMVLSIKAANIIIVFAAEAKILAHVQQWAEQLDQPNLQAGGAPGTSEMPGLFFYLVKNTAAEPLAQTLNGLLGEIIPSPTKETKAKLVVDKQRNVLLFTGPNQAWARLLPILQEMDKPAKQVLIEVTLAEIMLSDQDERGIEWVINKANLGGLDGKLTTWTGDGGGLGLGNQGLIYTLSNAGQVRAVLNAFTSNSRATILSTPRLMVRSGNQATIDVGSEIPTLSSQSTTNQLQGGNTAILQQIQYRSTGISLNITPIVYAGQRVDLKITQTISESQPNTTSNIDSPVILNRQLSTQLTLRDGHSVLLGGLISNNRNEGQTGIPLLKDIPLLGQLFRVDKTTGSRTELVMMIIPYIIDNDEEAKALSQAIQQRLELLPALTTEEPVSAKKSF